MDIEAVFKALKAEGILREIPKEEEIPHVEEPVARPKRCCMEGCKKKLMLTDFPCKCGKIHCTLHRAAEVHNCSYDFKSSAKESLQKSLPTVMAKKIDRI